MTATMLTKEYGHISPWINIGAYTVASSNVREHYGVRFFLDYNLLPSHSARSIEWMNTLTRDISVAVTL